MYFKALKDMLRRIRIKANLGRFINKRQPSDDRTSKRVVTNLFYKLRELGFESRAYKELKGLTRSKNNYESSRAAWFLSLWHADRYTPKDARKSLRSINQAWRRQNNSDISEGAVNVLRIESLRILGKRKKAIKYAKVALKKKWDDNVALAVSSTLVMADDKLQYINTILKNHGLCEIAIDERTDKSFYHRLMTKVDTTSSSESVSSRPMVSVIVPAYNSESTIGTALSSLLGQTWQNIEIIVVDDCSTDATAKVVKEYQDKDSRVKLISCKENNGPYVARNLALQQAKGVYVTCNDADDWSHAQKIERQVTHLENNESAIANMSQQSRATDDLVFFRRGNPGYYIMPNVSSLMFRREPVLNSIGYWDSVRFGADSDYVKRIKHSFGDSSIVVLENSLLSFQHQSSTSLTASSKFGYPGFFRGIRKDYAESQNFYLSKGGDVYYSFPMKERPFAVPSPLQLQSKTPQSNHYDVIIMSDFRLDGGSTKSSLEEVKAQSAAGLRTGLVQAYQYDYYHPQKAVAESVRELIDGDKVNMLVYGEEVTCDVLIVRYPPVLQEVQGCLPSIKPRKIIIAVNQTPMSEYSSNGVLRFDINKCNKNVSRYFNKQATWYPIGPQVRQTLELNHGNELDKIDISKDDWVNILNVDEWKRGNHRVDSRKVIIGRHSRPDYVKWPSSKEDILKIYPHHERVTVRVLGGAKIPEKIIGSLPANWEVHEFNAVTPKDFLSELDVFVYFTHPDWVESFGRVILEAMAVGVPVVLPHVYKDLFKDAAIYSEPDQVLDKVMSIADDESAYDAQVAKAHEYIQKKYSYDMHIKRLSLLRGNDA